MIIDGHCHVWENWPYQPPVPDPGLRARAEQLLYEMDANDVEHAVLICAAIGDNPRNADYAFSVAAAHPGRFTVFPDLECRWSADYGRPGALARLEAALRRWDFRGFTLYLDESAAGDWLTGEEGLAFFAESTRRNLIVSLSVLPHQVAGAIALARRFPTLPLLLHHFAFLGARTAQTPDALEMVLAAAACPNIYVKYSGMGNVAAPDQDFPYRDLAWMPARLTGAFGPSRMIWGSDYPVSRRHMTYPQTLSLLRRYGPFESDDLLAVLGGNIARLIEL